MKYIMETNFIKIVYIMIIGGLILRKREFYIGFYLKKNPARGGAESHIYRDLWGKP